MEKDGTMKYNNKLELIDAIKSNADLFIREYYDIKDEGMNTFYEEIEYSPYQMLVFCIGWLDGFSFILGRGRTKWYSKNSSCY